MKHIAVIFEGDINAQLGVFNAVLNRAKHLQQLQDYIVDVHLFQVYDGWLMRLFRHSKKQDWRPDEITAYGMKVHVTWFRRRWSDVLRHRFLHQPPHALLRRLHKLGWEMRGHDLICAHDRMAGHAAVFASERLNIPAFITWHGSSIHTEPQRDPIIKEMTIKLLHSATCNFFVSQGLLDKAHTDLTNDFPAEILLNGVNSQFKRYSDEKRAKLRKHYGINDGEKVVAFLGHFDPVKNVLMLPEIFREIERKCDQKIHFWAIGEGSQLDETRELMDKTGVNCLFTGHIPYEEVPDRLNCVDLLVLPSILEGLPLVVVEALACGARAVASNVTGTAEAVGRENAIDWGDNFVERFTDRAVQLLQGNIEQKLPEGFSWDATAQKESQIYQKYLNTK